MAPAFGNAAQHVLEEARAHLFTSRLVAPVIENDGNF
jgi:hypothetical protein